MAKTSKNKPHKRRRRQRGEKFDLQKALGKRGIELILIEWQKSVHQSLKHQLIHRVAGHTSNLVSACIHFPQKIIPKCLSKGYNSTNACTCVSVWIFQIRYRIFLAVARSILLYVTNHQSTFLVEITDRNSWNLTVAVRSFLNPSCLPSAVSCHLFLCYSLSYGKKNAIFQGNRDEHFAYTFFP